VHQGSIVDAQEGLGATSVSSAEGPHDRTKSLMLVANLHVGKSGLLSLDVPLRIT